MIVVALLMLGAVLALLALAVFAACGLLGRVVGHLALIVKHLESMAAWMRLSIVATERQTTILERLADAQRAIGPRIPEAEAAAAPSTTVTPVPSLPSDPKATKH